MERRIVALTESQLRDFAEALIVDHAFDIEFLSIFETYDSWHGVDISREEAERVDALIRGARVIVSFEDEE